MQCRIMVVIPSHLQVSSRILKKKKHCHTVMKLSLKLMQDSLSIVHLKYLPRYFSYIERNQTNENIY